MRSASFGYSIVFLSMVGKDCTFDPSMLLEIYVLTPVRFGNEACAILIGREGSFQLITVIVASPINSISSSP